MQRKKKRSIIFELHSIPIRFRTYLSKRKSLCKRLYLVSYSIPLSCMVVLLLGLGIMVAPNVSDKTFAAEDGAGDDSDISPQADLNTSTAKLSIGGDKQNIATETGTNTVAYRTQTVTVELDNISQYFLKFYGNDTLTPPAGGEAVVGTGTGGTVGKNIVPGKWGYAWEAGKANDMSDPMTDNAEMTYYTVPTTSADLAGPAIPDSNSLTFTGKLNFAANFPSNATLGNYTSTATLTLIATPKANTGVINLWRNAVGTLTNVDAGTDEMQGVGPDFCGDEIGVGWTVELKDNRIAKAGDIPTTYTIYKAADGNCWMGQNLALSGPITLASDDSDLPDGMTWELPASVGSGGENKDNINTSNTWDTSNYNIVQVKTGSTSLTNWKNGYGNYYSWPAATAGTSTTSVTNADASASICPKGWKLPAYSGDYSFQNLTNTKSSWTTANYNGNSGVSGYYFGTTATSIYKGANFWPAAGIIIQASGTLAEAGSSGHYWSRKAQFNTEHAFILDFINSDVYFKTSNFRYRGSSVRCVYEKLGEWKTSSGTKINESTGLHDMQDVTKENFTDKYCSRSADSLVPVGSTINLRDSRDNNIYTSMKMPDGTCWMMENLRLGDDTKRIPLTSKNTDLNNGLESWTLPANYESENPGETWNNSGYNEAMVKTGKNLGTDYKEAYGNYYSWCAATAGTCVKNGSQVTSGIAVSSICPRGWKLPASGDTGSFKTIYEHYPNAVNNYWLTNQAVPYNGGTTAAEYSGRRFGVDTANALFIAAGTTNKTGLVSAASYTVYWGRGASTGGNAYSSTFQDGRVDLSQLSARFVGGSIRCLADY